MIIIIIIIIIINRISIVIVIVIIIMRRSLQRANLLTSTKIPDFKGFLTQAKS